MVHIDLIYILKSNSYMIKETKVTIPINIRNVSRYREIGYDFDFDPKVKTNLDVSINDISKNSKVKITSICDMCGSEGTISISKYWINWSRKGYNFYSCFNCKSNKRKMTSLDKWGVDSFSKTKEFKDKFKESSLLRYGVDNPNKDKSVRDKIKKTNLKKYGLVTPLLSDENKEKNRVWMSSDEFKLKSKKSIINKWGVDSFSKTDEFKCIISEKKDLIVDKIKKTFMSKYGTEYFSSTPQWLDMFRKTYDVRENLRKKTCINRYGVDNVSKLKDVQDKISKTKSDNGSIIHSDDLGHWDLYKRKVRKETNKNKKLLYEEWAGNDYYDNEFIKGYLSYNHTHRFYPTIDHKISVMYGFSNDIDPSEIGSMDNLCITKRYINSIKSSLTESDFKKFNPQMFAQNLS